MKFNKLNIHTSMFYSKFYWILKPHVTADYITFSSGPFTGIFHNVWYWSYIIPQTQDYVSNNRQDKWLHNAYNCSYSSELWTRYLHDSCGYKPKPHWCMFRYETADYVCTRDAERSTSISHWNTISACIIRELNKNDTKSGKERAVGSSWLIDGKQSPK